MDIKFPDTMDGAASLTVLGAAIPLRADNTATVTPEQFLALEHLNPEAISMSPAEAAELNGPPPEEPLPIEPAGTTDPTVQRSEGSVVLRMTHHNGSTSTLVVDGSKVEDFTSQGWVVEEDGARSVPDAALEADASEFDAPEA